jgi:hypothetical protein
MPRPATRPPLAPVHATGRHRNGRVPLTAGRELTPNERRVLDAANRFRAAGRRASIDPLGRHLDLCIGTVGRILRRLEAAGLLDSREPLETPDRLDGADDISESHDPPPPDEAEIAALARAIRAERRAAR